MFDIESDTFDNCDNNNPNISITTKFSVKDILNMSNNDNDYNNQIQLHGNYFNLYREHNSVYYEDYHQYPYQNWDNCYTTPIAPYETHTNNYSYQNFYDIKTENDSKIECENSYLPQVPVNNFCVDIQQDCKDYVKSESPSK